MGIEEVERLLADRLSIIEEGKGHWAECIKAIEAYGDSRRTQAFLSVKAIFGIDGHRWTKRPCSTCQKLTDLMGFPFGCNAMAAKEDR